ncbi:MAG: hypothetical protein EPN72_03200 [Nevskiaceae bacterium]|nr:MAG: hypothetical protein EPN63_13575 [Nevskiaceae bacterium]TBR74310.1 MAG: hypothetical protein EPN72_03200 [Nevskiaceae bacterium]
MGKPRNRAGHPDADADASSVPGFAHVAYSDLTDVIFRRRSRRFGLGMSIPDGPLAWTSKSEPVPLSPLEEGVLLALACGVVGLHEGIPFRDGENALSSYSLRFGGRASPSGGGIGTGELIYTNDTGTYIVRTRDIQPVDPRLAGTERLQAVVEQVRCATHRLFEHRVEIPRKAPHISAHNLWNANVPGSTVFFPVVDVAQYLMGFMAMQIQCGAVFFDERTGESCGDLEPFIRSGLLNRDRRVPLVETEKYGLALSAVDCALVCQNIVLAEQIMGLGGWLFTGINPISLMGGYADAGAPGLGFRFVRNKDWLMPNPVGIDGVYEGWTPPYVANMHEAAQRMAAMKFGPQGAYTANRPGPYSPEIQSSAVPYSDEFVACLGTVAQYVHDRYGKFPSTTPTIYARPYAQAHHLDLDWYEHNLGSHSYTDAHRRHFEDWHRGA